MGKNEFLFKVKVMKFYKEDIKVNFMKEDKLVIDFLEMVEGIFFFLSENCIFEGGVLKVGELEIMVKLIFKDVEKLNNLLGYVMVIKLMMEGLYEYLVIV